MERLRILKNSQIIILGLCIAFATLFSTVILSKTFIKIKKFTNEIISVTGSAEEKIVSDRCVWRASFSRISPDLTLAYKALRKDLKRVQSYLAEQGLDPKDVIVSQVNIETLYKKTDEGYSTNDIEGYRLSQNIEVQSNDVYKMTDISRGSTELITKGIGFVSDPPQYFYTKLSDLKLQMLGEATLDAKRRAEQMATSTGNKIGVMHSADMGVFQITPVHSYEVSSYGYNDTSSLEKKVTAVVHADFGISE